MLVQTPPDCRPRLRDKRVLVVEDEAIIAMAVEDDLLTAGARVVGPAASISEALQMIETAMADGGLNAAVLDIKLEQETVSPVAERLAALGVPFLFATGYGPDCDTGGYTAVPVLHKPICPHELIIAVEILASATQHERCTI
jgi:CheY-like chemotaxis protein